MKSFIHVLEHIWQNSPNSSNYIIAKWYALHAYIHIVPCTKKQGYASSFVGDISYQTEIKDVG